MAQTTFSADNANRPAPLWYRRMSNGLILFIIPGLIGLIQGLPMSSDKRNIWMMVLAFFPSLLKGISIMLGNGQYIDDKPEEKTSETKPSQNGLSNN